MEYSIVVPVAYTAEREREGPSWWGFGLLCDVLIVGRKTSVLLFLFFLFVSFEPSISAVWTCSIFSRSLKIRF